MTLHVVKSWRRFFQQIAAGTRTHELRRNDRGYQVSDLLELHEFDHETQRYTGAVCTVEVTSITSADEQCAVSKEALHNDFCILSVRCVVPAVDRRDRSNVASAMVSIPSSGVLISH